MSRQHLEILQLSASYCYFQVPPIIHEHVIKIPFDLMYFDQNQ